MTGDKLLQGLQIGLELVSAGQLILARLAERQNERAAEGRELTDEDLRELMDEGDRLRDAARARIEGRVAADADAPAA